VAVGEQQELHGVSLFFEPGRAILWRIDKNPLLGQVKTMGVKDAAGKKIEFHGCEVLKLNGADRSGKALSPA
jgi:hypothetical protein